MISSTEYREENRTLMEEYETRVRAWLSKVGSEDMAVQLPFFRDGITCPEVWFQENNSFRPLFILKEVSLGINYVRELPSFLEKWGYPQYFDFAENPFDDIRVGTFPQWRRIACLAKGLEEIHNGADECDYYKFNFDFIPGGELYTGDIEGYKSDTNCERTANATYRSIIDKIAVLEIKKMGAGQTVNSELSLAARHYSEHIAPFQDLMCRQIKLIDPTVIICLGREWGACTSRLLEQVKANTSDRLWIDGYHHTRSSNQQFYYDPLATYKRYLGG